MLGVEYNECLYIQHKKQDELRTYRKNYYWSPAVRKKAEHTALLVRKMIEDNKKAKLKGMTYGKRITGPTVQTENELVAEKEDEEKTVLFCLLTDKEEKNEGKINKS